MRDMDPSTVRRIATRTLVAAGIRLGGMGLSLLMLVAIARATDAADFGLFSLLLSLATTLGYVALAGQHIAILRFWPITQVRFDAAAADRLLGTSIAVATLGCMGTALVFAVISVSGLTGHSSLVFWTGALTLALAFAELSANTLRAKGHIVRALAPRDILWRSLVICGALAGPGPLEVHTVLAIVTVLLTLATVPQHLALLRDSFRSRKAALPKETRRALFKATPVLWLSSSSPPLIEYATTIVVGIALGPLSAGIYFAADRLAKVLLAGLISVEQVVAPDLARTWHRTELTQARRIVCVASAVGFAAALPGALFYLAFGHWVLALFDAGFAQGYPVLIILAGGQVVHALLGINAVMLTMAGAERILLTIRLVWGAAAIATGFAGATLWGLSGAACASALVLIGSNISVVIAGRIRLVDAGRIAASPAR